MARRTTDGPAADGADESGTGATDGTDPHDRHDRGDRAATAAGASSTDGAAGSGPGPGPGPGPGSGPEAGDARGGGPEADGGRTLAARLDSGGDGIAALLSGVRVGQFVSVGAVGATAEQIVLAILTAGYGVAPLAAKAVGAELSITLMFLLNDRWTFAGEGATGSGSRLRRWARSHLVRLGGLAVGFAVLTLLTEFTTVTLVVAGADFWPTVANGIGIACGMVLNYVFESVFTWRVHR